jgi:hypothetical protein
VKRRETEVALGLDTGNPSGLELRSASDSVLEQPRFSHTRVAGKY